MSRKFDELGFNTQFKWQPIRRDRWDPFPKDHLPFIDDQSISRQQHMPPRRNFTPVEAGSTPDPVNNLMPEQGTPGGMPPQGTPGGLPANWNYHRPRHGRYPH